MTDFILNVFKPFWMLWAMAVFIGIVVWAYRPSNKSKFEGYSNIPLRDDDTER